MQFRRLPTQIPSFRASANGKWERACVFSLVLVVNLLLANERKLKGITKELQSIGGIVFWVLGIVITYTRVFNPLGRSGFFLVADTHLYKRLCPSVGPSVGASICPSVREHKSKSAETSVLDAFCACKWGNWGVDWGWMPLPTRPQRFLDPASLVLSVP